MEKNPLVSIVLPIYNGEEFMEKSIKSCLNQTYKNIELIIVNDNSIDNTFNIVNKIIQKDGRVKLVNNKTNLKLPKSLNIGHAIAKGDYITWTSHDNLYLPNAIEKMVAILNDKKLNIDIVYSDFYLINQKGEITKTLKLKEPEELIFKNTIGACFLYKKKVFLENKGYNEELFLVEDYDFWLRSFFKFKFYHLNSILYNYREHSKSLTNEIIENNNSKKVLWQDNILKMTHNISTMYSYPDKLKEFILEFQIHNKINSNEIIENFNDITLFFKRISTKNNVSFNNLLCSLKEKYIKGVRNKPELQTIKSSLYLLLFYKVLNFNDYKTMVKIFTHKLFKL
ncbi:glycosyltransferase [Polaribacter sp. WD7]|uniref:glycosyltransferase family 2 protein n=1 Tax=Polaribacter sp. WD7 TaxID=2269061 RepID=UPI000DF4C60D|nr:glycosyltransferase [Polaribacter sp. WD7]RCS27068.1 glycosyltransferase [Polaribacter sp. WD7]